MWPEWAPAAPVSLIFSLALLVGCKSDKAPPSPSSGPTPSSSQAPAPPEPSGEMQPGTSVRSPRVTVEVPAPKPGSAVEGSGQIDPTAQRRAPTGTPEDRRKKIETLHADLDADHDGKVTLDELRRSPLARFEMGIDTDRDGNVSVDELDAALAKATRQPSR